MPSRSKYSQIFPSIIICLVIANVSLSMYIEFSEMYGLDNKIYDPIDDGWYEFNANEDKFMASVTWNNQQIKEATLRRTANYQYQWDATYYVKYLDGAWVGHNKGYLLDIEFEDYLSDGDIVTMYCRFVGVGDKIPHIIITASDDPTTIYAEYTFQNSGWQWINITLNLPHDIKDFDIRVSPNQKGNKYFYVDYIGAYTSEETTGWHNEFGSAINNYTVSVWYNVTAESNVNASSVYMELSCNATYSFTNGTVWIENFIIDNLIDVPSLNVIWQWDSTWISLPEGPPPNGEQNITVSLSFNVEVFGRLNDSEDWVQQFKTYDELRTLNMYWYY